MKFIPAVLPPESVHESDWFFMYYQDSLLVNKDHRLVSVPNRKNVEDLIRLLKTNHYLGSLNGIDCYGGEFESRPDIPEGMEFSPGRQRVYLLSRDALRMAGVASQVVLWDKTHRYCGQCGAVTNRKKNERARVCPSCGHTAYPRLSPSIIVSIEREDSILLARSSRFPKEMYSVLAGFVEPGESLEECVEREVWEEVGIKVKNLKYTDSETWPFPHSLMLGFTAEYGSGEIKIDGVEIEDAGWYSVDNLPLVPKTISIAGRLIEAFIQKHKS